MIIVGLVACFLAAALHVFIFWLESVAWTGDLARRTFGLSPADAEATKELAFNQGFYNLFLAIATFAGIVVHGLGNPAVGLTLVLVGTGSMFAASVVLVLADRTRLSSALKQGLLPLVGIILVVVGLLLG